MRFDYDHNGVTFHAIVLPKKVYFALLNKLNTSHPDEIPALYIAHDKQTEWIFDAVKADKENMLAVSPHFSGIDEYKLRRYLGLINNDKAKIEVDLTPELYAQIMRNAPRNTVDYCNKLAKTLKSSKFRKIILDSWAGGLPSVIKYNKLDWWDRYFNDLLQSIETTELHHLAMGQMKDFERYLANVAIGTCYFLSVQNKDPYEGKENDDEDSESTEDHDGIGDEVGADVSCHSAER